MDGFRAAIERTVEAVRIWSRQARDLARYFPDLSEVALKELARGFTVDGEAVVWTDGRVDFGALQSRLTAGSEKLAALVRDKPAPFAAFDVLLVAGHDARALPLRERRALLEELAASWSAPLALSSAIQDFDEANRWFEDLIPSGIEGLVAKGLAEPYKGGKQQWLKVKHRDNSHVVCAAVTGTRSRPDTLVEPIVVDISADTAWSGRSFRHAVRFVMSRPEMHRDDAQVPLFLSSPARRARHLLRRARRPTPRCRRAGEDRPMR